MAKFTKSDLRAKVMATGSHFFDRHSMAFFGDTMANFGLRSAEIVIRAHNGDSTVSFEVWELYRKKSVKHGIKTSHYFDKDTYRTVYPVKTI